MTEDNSTKKIKITHHKNIRIMLSFFVPVIIGRLFILIFSPDIYYSSVMDVFYIIRGIVSDLLFTAIYAYIVSFIPFKKVIWGFWIFTCIFAAANAEHIIVNIGNIDFRYTVLGASSTFFSGSVFTLRVILLMGANLFLSGTVIYWVKKYREKRKNHEINSNHATWQRIFPYFSFLLLGLLVLPMNYAVFPCVQMGLVEENIKKTYYNLYVDWFHKQEKLPDDVRNKLFGQDLNAPLVLTHPSKKPNILVVLIESIGYGTIEKGMMPKLKKFGEENTYIGRYMISQKQTDRGIYNILCGDYPNLVYYKAKSDLMTKERIKCLPRLLTENGYHTEFIQSAPLQFMNKDKDMPKAGFEKVFGSASFKKVLGETAWGVDDRTLYYAAMDEIKSQKKPWFMTLLTVGTHHPYRPNKGEKSSYPVAVKYADNSIMEFLDNLKKMGVLDNTLVVITADESHGPLNNGTIPLIARNHSFMIIKPPGKSKTRIVNDLFAASDFMLSISDYLNLPVKNLMGRSLFRDYEREDRHLVFGNTYAGVFYYLNNENLSVCNYDYECSYYQLKGKFFKNYQYMKTGAERSPKLLQAIVQYNDWKR